MNTKNPLKLLRALVIALVMTLFQVINRPRAYRIGYRGERLGKGFSTLGEDSRPEDMARVVRVRCIDHDNNAPGWLIDLTTRAYIPVLAAYVRGLRDGCRELGNDHVYDMSRQFQRMLPFTARPNGPAPGPSSAPSTAAK